MCAVSSVDTVPATQDVDPDESFLADLKEFSNRAQGLAACKAVDPEIFFPISTSDHGRRALALQVCSGCTVRRQCLDIALRDRTLVGIWGGTDELERNLLRRSAG